LLATATNNHVVRALVLAGFVALGGNTPGADRMTTAGGTTFTTTVRVINRVHGHTANRRANTTPSSRTGLAQRAQAVFAVGHFAHGGTTLGEHLAHFATAKTQGYIGTFTGHQLSG